ncbi:ABC transporter permease [Bifidobacterium psychraerophilum]|uniref:ABC transporter permease n=1 Tax=Bifidobacterium psychraerophilum TaxID=218140 RepID=A0A087CBV8_9BIFI|nr:ABC transporter permease [Bifidobacterium psychraerophilum]KFI80758.1 ABC transporter permease [Bifidobacterium psychraerophilum]MCI1659758.1 ABC transporter permease [Bifidobacterium psychraerophilum]MCI1805504.1 ABC transporter permease [Bifidobacterium psychraerophilum]MCI2176889.1 ABC transporter permease [Bifidobacterium psychraerophilum]MCI2182154.1 ABC transporter permease [Bifidobacterium psychraerophilum]
MGRYVMKRLLSAVPVLMIVGIIAFALSHLSGGDPARVVAGNDATTEQVEAIREQMGLNASLPNQLWTWFVNMLHGDLGYSYILNEKVTPTILSHVFPTLSVALFGELIALAIAIPLGVLAADKHGRLADKIVLAFATLTTSLPSFLAGLLLMILFVLQLKLLPASGFVYPSDDFAGYITHLILPAVSVATLQIALISRMSRSSMIDALGSDYIRTAAAKGLPRSKQLWGHAFKNSSIPILTIVGQSFGELIAGAIVVETVFNVPGIGQLVVNSILRRDYQMIQGIMIFVALVFIIVNLITDVLYAVIDPRIRERSF